MGSELSGILSGTGAKMKGEVMEDHVVFRGAVKAAVPFEEIVAEARGTLLILSFAGNTVELGAGARAAQLAAKIRSPPQAVDKMGVHVGMTAAAAGALSASFKSELSARAVVEPGAPKAPVDVLVFGAETQAQLGLMARLVPLTKADGSLWVVHARGVASLRPEHIATAAKGLGLAAGQTIRFSSTHDATRLARRNA